MNEKDNKYNDQGGRLNLFSMKMQIESINICFTLVFDDLRGAKPIKM